MDVKSLLKELTLEEKASLCSGEDFWQTKGIDRLGISGFTLSDGPNGVRLQKENTDHLGINTSVKAVCFPCASAVASSYDRGLAYRIGEVLGNECKALNIAMLLGPGMNIKRSPLCGRNFEYFSEDPYLSGQLATAYVKGIQSKGVGACVKHFAANNQETQRSRENSIIDERTLHEIYLSGFEQVVKEGQPSGVMCAYNKINGIYAAENKMLLTDILREKWGYSGLVITDWGAAKDRLKGILAGLDLEMPGSEYSLTNDQKIARAVKEGTLAIEQLDACASRLLKFMAGIKSNHSEDIKFNLDRDYEEAVNMARECAVLLKNDHRLLPLKKTKKTAFIGGFIEKPRYQGSGSAHINSAKVPTVKDLIEKNKAISYAKGFSVDADVIEDELVLQAVTMAKSSDIAVIFAGLPDRFESEGIDRKHMDLPENQTHLIFEVLKVQPNTVVVLHNGAPITMPWVADVSAILEMYLAGDGVSEATMELLYGEAVPCGKLAESFPVKLEDNPSFLNFPGVDGEVKYNEGIFVGYRYYDKKKQSVLFPFGHGLSYTEFSYSDMHISDIIIKDTEKLEVSVLVRNNGNYRGKEVVQLYVEPIDSIVQRPLRELKGFEKVELEPNESHRITFTLDKYSFAYYETKIHDWYAPSGNYVVHVGSSSADLRQSKEIRFEASFLPFTVTRESTLGELKRHPILKNALNQMLEQMTGGTGCEPSSNRDNSIEGMGEGGQAMVTAMISEMTLETLISLGRVTETQLDGIIQMFNAQL